MFNALRRSLGRFFRNSSKIKNEPLNKVSLIIIILIDIFILFNTFSGLNEISQWPLNPSQAYPCQGEWLTYRQEKGATKDIGILRSTLERQPGIGSSPGELTYEGNPVPTSFQQQYQQAEATHLGSVSATCLNYGALQDGVTNPENKGFKKSIDQKQTEISKLQASSAQIRAQYDSTLLEKVAGQSPGQSINAVSPEKAKQQLTDNNNQSLALKQEIKTLEAQILQNPGSVKFLAFLNNNQQWEPLAQAYEKALFWHPTIQLIFQACFLLPLILLALLVHRFCLRKGYGLAALISWHLLVVFLIPFVLKVFEFLQFGAIFEALTRFIIELSRGLIFLIRYAAILAIPLLGFGLIRFFQRFVFNPKIQAANRVQKSRCIRCAKRLGPHDDHCPHCGYHQMTECPSCHAPTYKHLPHCKSCGAPQPGLAIAHES
jgi:hypothetical protein